MFFEQMHPTWQTVLADAKPLLDQIEAKLDSQPGGFVPPKPLVMRAFETALDDVCVLLVGQDPYPTEGHAIGLSFAVDPSVKPLPRSLTNILRELQDDLGRSVSATGNLQQWQEQGVMLLNRHLTTDVGDAGAHTDLGWAAFTNKVVQVLNRKRIVAILWGAQAQELLPLLVDCQVIASAHPSPLSARKGFFGSKPFSKANAELRMQGRDEINWSC
ncbi:uracil-DNA glycosylase [Rhodoluna sp.]|uniref:uracil-DNA glycosylase n=1 Tax=Rhodoluna sp. TaxID=1969481 RepID=UPI0025CC71F1|nr:uracil-DNA glycosylase [Rhodoluna sp.]